jgi:ApbE superfamily uncharacterized protein (UPF0280 family)
MLTTSDSDTALACAQDTSLARAQATSLAYAHGAGRWPLLGETIADNLRRTVDRFGDREALVVRHQNVRLT